MKKKNGDSANHRSRWDNRNSLELLRAIVLLEDTREAKKFLRDLLTEQEIIEFGKRWKAARMLNNKVPYTTIIEETGLSSTTVARISKWLQQGEGGYKLMLRRIYPNEGQ